MKRLYLHRFTPLAMCVGFASMAVAAGAGQALGEASVSRVVGAMEAASKAGDAKTAASYMADDCVITTTFPGKDGGKKVSTKDKRKYVADENAAASAKTDRTYSAAPPAIEIEASGKVAKASYKVTEGYVQDGRKVSLVAYEIATVEIRQGEAKITAMDVDALSMSIDDRQIF